MGERSRKGAAPERQLLDAARTSDLVAGLSG
jgi:hypothetical protein